MIVYFSGTGNSLYVAQSLLDTDEKLGFVFPVYFYTVPSMLFYQIQSVEMAKDECCKCSA